MWSKVTPRKVGVGLKRRRELSKRRLDRRLAWWGSTEKKEASHLLGLRERHHYSTSAPIKTELLVWHPMQFRDRGGGELNGQIVSAQRAAHGRRQRSMKIIDEKREK